MIIRTPDYHLRVFVSSTLKELAEERGAVRRAIANLRLAPVMFESGARPHPAQELYKSYLAQSQVFIGIYWKSYGWVAPDMQISGLEDEYNLSKGLPRLIYIKQPSPDREPALTSLLERIRNDNTSSYTYFSDAAELTELVENDLALMLTERFETADQAVEKVDEHPIPAWLQLKTNVPVPRNPLIGREKELADVCDLLRREEVALLTLTGAGGTGKSRLAIQAGIEILIYFPDGVYMVRLDPIRDPAQLLSTIAETFGLRETQGGQPIGEMLVDYLRNKQLLLILDNFEQMVEAAPQVAELLEDCPRLKCLVTSRLPLRVRAEREYPVPPLVVPSLQKSTNLDSLSQYAAVELFIQRSQAVKPDFAVTNANAPAVAEICFRLDGLPLAIELAAARIKLLSPQGLLARLGNRFDLLTGGTRDLPERQRTLRSAIDWSFDLLNEVEKILFRRMAVFVDGCTLEAAENVCDLDGDLTHNLDDTLEALINCNLIIQLQPCGDDPRYGMLGSIRDYACEKLVESGEEPSIHHKHAQYFLNYVTTVEPRVRSAEREKWQQAMQSEFGNIRGVMDWIDSSQQCIEIGQNIVIRLGTYWHLNGHIAEGRQLCEKMLAFCDETTSPTIRAGLLCYESELAWAQGDQAKAVESSIRSLELSRQQDDPRVVSIALLMRGLIASGSRDLDTAADSFAEAADIFKQTDQLWYLAAVLSWLGDVVLYQGDKERAKALHSESMQVARQQGDPWCLIPSLMSSAQEGIVDGDLSGAHKHLTEAIEVLHKTGDNWSMAYTLTDLAHVALLSNDLEQAADYIRDGLSFSNTMGNLRASIIGLAQAAELIAIRAPGGDEARLSAAAQLCGATAAYIDDPGIFIWFDTRQLYEEAVAKTKAMMSASLWEQAFSAGKSLSIDQAYDQAVRQLKPPT